MSRSRFDLEDLLARAAATARSSAIALVALRCGALLLAAWLAAFLLDALLPLPANVRVALLVVLGPGAVAFAAWRLARVARARPNRAEAARLLETRLGLPGNPLIDAVLLGADARAGRPGVEPEFAARVVEEAQHVAGRVDAASVRERAGLRRAETVLAGAAALGVVLALALPGGIGRMAGRFLRPYVVEADPGGLSIEVSPGGARAVAGTPVDVRAVVRTGGRVPLPDEADLEIASGAAAPRRVPMAARPAPRAAAGKAAVAAASSERRFEGRVEVADGALRYRVLAGDASSPWFRVDVVVKPGIAGASVRLVPPAYTGRPAVEAAVGEAGVAALVGTEATLRLRPTRPCRAGALRAPGADALPLALVEGGDLRAAFAVTRSGPLVARLTGADGVENPDAAVASLTAVEDALPTVRIDVPTPNLVVMPGERVEFPVRAEDDVGLKTLRLLGSIEGDAREVELWKVGYPVPGPGAARERPVVTFDPGGFEVGRTYRIVAEAEDHGPARPGRARSAPVLVRVKGPQDLALPPGSPLARAFERLRALIEAVRAERARLATLLDLYDEHVREGRLVRRVVEARVGHEALPARLAETAAAFRAEPTGERAASTLDAIASGDLAEAVRAVGQAVRAADPRPDMTRARDADDLVIARLLELLGDLAGAQKPTDPAELAAQAGPKSPADRKATLAEDLKRFVMEQKKILETTREVEKRAGEDLSKGDEELLGRLAAQEEAWAKLFEELFTDLSKVPPQDFADGKLREELNQVYMEVQKAAEALSSKKVELAVPAEQSGLELAESMETNLERWLPDTKDHEKWVMEEPPQEFDVPLADLPSELEDIVGDLLDDEKQMDQDVEDVSSSWMDSIDKGAGWDASDGPISNMSARGVTGNRLPNQNEVAGRSGEGRSGRSHGQMVEQTAEGKGGRETPTRRTDDPYEAGSVKDSSRDPRGGSTGGGKVAGQGDTGLRGTPPPPVQAKLERLRGNQGELRQRAERLQRWLRALHLPAGDLDDAAARMKRIEDRLAAGRGFDLRQAHADVKDALEEARRALQAEADTLRANEPPLPPEVKQEVFSGLREPAPPGLADVVRAFYEALARGRRPAGAPR